MASRDASAKLSCRWLAAAFEFGETRRLFDLGGEALAFKPRYNVQLARYMSVLLPGKNHGPDSGVSRLLAKVDGRSPRLWAFSNRLKRS